MLNNSNELTAWDRDRHPSTHMGMHARGETPTRVLEGGEGVYIADANGRKSLDAFLAGLARSMLVMVAPKLRMRLQNRRASLPIIMPMSAMAPTHHAAKMIIDRAPDHMEPPILVCPVRCQRKPTSS